jgi:hypothetical protein
LGRKASLTSSERSIAASSPSERARAGGAIQFAGNVRSKGERRRTGSDWMSISGSAAFETPGSRSMRHGQTRNVGACLTTAALQATANRNNPFAGLTSDANVSVSVMVIWGSHRGMNVQLSPSHEQWLNQQVASGVFPSIEAAIAWVIEGMKPVADDDLEWARPLLEVGEASLAQGDGIEGDAFLAALARRIEALR